MNETANTTTTSTLTKAEIMEAYKTWRKEFNLRWDSKKEEQRKYNAECKELFTQWKKELDEYIANRDLQISQLPIASTTVTASESKKSSGKFVSPSGIEYESEEAYREFLANA